VSDEKPQRKPEAHKVMNRAEVAAVLWAAREEQDAQAYALFALQYLLGLRVGEAVLLRYEHLGPLAQGWPVCVYVPTLKRRGSKPPLLPVPVLSHAKLVRWAFSKQARPLDKRESGFLFPGQAKRKDRHCSVSWAVKRFKGLAKTGNCHPGFSSHALRHSAGSHLFAACGQESLVRRFLRHSGGGQWAVGSPSAVTERYIHVTGATWRRYRGCLDIATLGPVPYAPGSPARDLWNDREGDGPIRPPWRNP